MQPAVQNRWMDGMGWIYICSSLASRPDTDLTMFSKQSQHTDFFMLFFVYFLYTFFSVCVSSIYISSSMLFYSFWVALTYFSSKTHWKGILMTWLHIYLCEYSFFGCRSYLFNGNCFFFFFCRMKWSKYVRIFSKPKALIADNVLLRLFRPFL